VSVAAALLATAAAAVAAAAVAAAAVAASAVAAALVEAGRVGGMGGDSSRVCMVAVVRAPMAGLASTRTASRPAGLA
jgi:hypothetical protein